MANYTLTLADLTKAVTHALGGSPDINLDATGIINDALLHLCNMRSWHWRQRVLNLDSTNGQSYIALPADFNMMVTLKLVGDASDKCKPTSMDQIVQMRQTGNTFPNALWYAISYLPQVSATVEPTPIIEIYPTPASTTNSAPYFMTGQYLRQVPMLTGSTSIPDIPSNLHPALRMLCRAFAVSDEDQQTGADWQKFDQMIAPLETQDGLMTGNLGRMRGGLCSPRMPGLAGNTRQIGGP